MLNFSPTLNSLVDDSKSRRKMKVIVYRLSKHCKRLDFLAPELDADAIKF